MTTRVAEVASTSSVTVDPAGRADRAVAQRAFRQVRTGAAVCALVFGGTAASSALTYVSTFPSESSRQMLAAATSADVGFAVLLGPIASIETVGGYTVYKCYVFLTTIGALWALLAATRVLRGEEDAGRWQVVLAGSTRPGRATALTLAALGAATGVVFAGTTVIVALTGRNPDIGFGAGEAVLYGASLTVAPAVFMAVGAVTSQLGRTRRMATGLGLAVFGVVFILRMIGDSGPGARWLLWTTPFGWTELMQPLTVNDPRPLVPAVITVVTLCGLAVHLATRRDAGDGVLSSRDTAALRPFGLGSSTGLALRLELGVVVAWCVGTAAAAFVFGMLAKLTTASIPESMADTLDRFGVEGSFTYQFFGVGFLLVATLVALLPAGQVGAACGEETSGRLVHVLASPTTRAAWLAGRLATGGIGIVVAGLLAGVFAWVGAATQGVGVDLGKMVVAGVNVVPTGLVALGIGAVVLSVAPRAASGAVYAVVIWSLLVDLLAGMVTSVNWLVNASLFHYMTLAPAQDPRPTTLALTTMLALALCGVATILFSRRDVHST